METSNDENKPLLNNIQSENNTLPPIHANIVIKPPESKTEEPQHKSINIKIHAILYDLSFYMDIGNPEKKIPLVVTPLIKLMPKGETQIGSSSKASVITLDLSGNIWRTAMLTHDLNNAKVDLSHLEVLLKKYESITTTQYLNQIPSKCNILPFFSNPNISFGNLKNVHMYNIFIVRDFINAISKVNLFEVRLSGCIAENCTLQLTRDIRVIHFDCTRTNESKMNICIPYGCRIELFELYCSWGKKNVYYNLCKIYTVDF